MRQSTRILIRNPSDIPCRRGGYAGGARDYDQAGTWTIPLFAALQARDKAPIPRWRLFLFDLRSTTTTRGKDCLPIFNEEMNCNFNLCY
jgi:hypothetical protein